MLHSNKEMLLNLIFKTAENLKFKMHQIALNFYILSTIPFLQSRFWALRVYSLHPSGPLRGPCNPALYDEYFGGAVIIIIIIESSCGSLAETQPNISSWKCESNTHTHPSERPSPFSFTELRLNDSLQCIVNRTDWCVES